MARRRCRSAHLHRGFLDRVGGGEVGHLRRAGVVRLGAPGEDPAEPSLLRRPYTARCGVRLSALLRIARTCVPASECLLAHSAERGSGPSFDSAPGRFGVPVLAGLRFCTHCAGPPGAVSGSVRVVVGGVGRVGRVRERRIGWDGQGAASASSPLGCCRPGTGRRHTSPSRSHGRRHLLDRPAGSVGVRGRFRVAWVQSPWGGSIAGKMCAGGHPAWARRVSVGRDRDGSVGIGEDSPHA